MLSISVLRSQKKAEWINSVWVQIQRLYVAILNFGMQFAVACIRFQQIMEPFWMQMLWPQDFVGKTKKRWPLRKTRETKLLSS